MSNLFKSKFLLGVMVVAVMFGAFAVVKTEKAAASTCTITTTLRVGSKGAEVKCLQAGLDNGLAGDGSFGPKTKASVVAWQKSVGLVADGVFGAKSRAAWTGVTMTFPAGCTSGTGFSSTTGQPCTGTVNTTLPAGCTSTAGFSPVTGASCSTGAVGNQTGPVSVMLSSDNPASGYIIANQATADLLHFTFTGSGTVNSVVLQRTGISDQNTLNNVYLYDGTMRLTDGYSFNNSGQMTINGLAIAVNGSKTISVKADVADKNTTANASSLGITLTGFTAAGNSATMANVKGNEMTVGVGNLATVNLNNNTYSAARTVNAGTSAFTIWSAPMQVNTRAIFLKGANFRMTGSAPADALQNMHLYVDGVIVGNPAVMGSITGTNYAMFDFSVAPVSLSTGSHTLELRADVVKGASYKVTVSIQQAADLVLYDPQLGVNVASLGNNGGAFTANASGEITINAGSASVVVDPTFQSMTNVTGGATNVVIGKFKIHGYGEDVKVSTLDVTPLLLNANEGTYTTDGSGTCSTSAHCGLNNLAVYFNGSQVGSSFNWLTGMHEFNLGSQMILPAGVDSFIEIHADLQSTDNHNYTAGTVTVTLPVPSSTNAQGQTSHSSLSFPASSVATSGLTVQTGLLAVAVNGAYPAQTIGPNTANVKIASYTLQNQSSSESVRVTSLALHLTKINGGVDLTNTGSTTNAPAVDPNNYPALTNFSNLKTSETSGSGATPIQPSGSNTFSVDFTIAPGATKTIDVYADTSSTAANAQFGTTLVVTSLGLSSNVSISQNGNATAVNGQNITLFAGTFGNAGAVVSSSTAPQYVPAGTTGATNATKATFNFKSVSGTATVSELKFLVTTNTGASVSSVSVGGVTVPVVNGVAYLTGLNISVPNGGSGVNVDAFMTYGPVGTNGNTSGATSKVEMTYIRYQLGGTTTTLTGGQNTMAANTIVATATAGTMPALLAAANAITFSSTAALQPGMVVGIKNSSGGTDGVGEVQSVTDSTHANLISLVVPGTAALGATTEVHFFSVPQNAAYASSVNNCLGTPTVAGVTLAVGATSGADCMVIVGSKPALTVVDATTQLINGLIKVGSVTVAADTHGDIAINNLPLAFTSTGHVTADLTTAGNVVIKNAADQSTINTTMGTSTNLSAGGTNGRVTMTFVGGYTVSAGNTVTLDIYATTANVTGGPSANTLSMNLGSDPSLFTWTDVAGNGTTGAQTGTLIYNFPTNSSIIND
jgi:hypothetical protein